MESSGAMLCALLFACRVDDAATTQYCRSLEGEAGASTTILRVHNASSEPVYLAASEGEAARIVDGAGERVPRSVDCELMCSNVLADRCEIACSVSASVVRIGPGAVVEEPWDWTRFTEIEIPTGCTEHEECGSVCAVERAVASGSYSLEAERYPACPLADEADCTCRDDEEVCGLFSFDALVPTTTTLVAVPFTNASANVTLMLE